MAAVKNKDIPEEYEFFGELFTFRKKFYKPEENDEYWEALVDETRKLADKHNHNDFFDAMLILCIDDIEKREGKAYKDRDLLTKTYSSLMKKRGGA